MEILKFLPILLVYFLLAVVASQADPNTYWKSKLPYTPMPKAVRDALHNGGNDATTISEVMVKPDATPLRYTGYRPLRYANSATDDQLHNSQNVVVFFLEKDLHRGTSMNLKFTKSSANTAAFLPRKVADSIPFSTKQFPEILKKYSLKPKSKEAEVIKETIKECEEPGVKGEDKFCATSLESMIDFSISRLGKNVQAVSTEAPQDDTKPSKYTILDIRKLNKNGKAVSCHKQKYVYAVFYCHSALNTEAYMVSLVSTADGAKAKAVAVCHKDTAAWNPEHLAFQVLKVKPGTIPICHFFPVDHVVWVPK